MRGKEIHRSRGYTMLEIFVAVAIIGILATIAVPAFQRMKGMARSAHCVSNLRQIGMVVSQHMAENGMKLPTMVAAREDRNEDKPALDTVLRPYLNDEIWFKCPCDYDGIFERTGTSYFWNSALSGQDIAAINFLGMSKNQAGIPLVADKENFHKNVGDEVNVLYVDGHVTRELTFIADP